jgi:hypothetical protein
VRIHDLPILVELYTIDSGSPQTFSNRFGQGWIGSFLLLRQSGRQISPWSVARAPLAPGLGGHWRGVGIATRTRRSWRQRRRRRRGVDNCVRRRRSGRIHRDARNRRILRCDVRRHGQRVGQRPHSSFDPFVPQFGGVCAGQRDVGKYPARSPEKQASEQVKRLIWAGVRWTRTASAWMDNSHGRPMMCLSTHSSRGVNRYDSDSSTVVIISKWRVNGLTEYT